MAFKWNTTCSSLEIRCPKCGKAQDVDMSDFIPQSIVEPKSDSDYETRYIVNVKVFCNECGEESNGWLEYIEYLPGIGEYVNHDPGPLFDGHTDNELNDLVDFSCE